MEITTITKDLATAIATAEGFFVPGSLPSRINNPGDLELGDIGFGMDNKKTIYPTIQQGWDELWRIIQHWFDNASQIYHPWMSLTSVAFEYTGNDHPVTWCQAVVDKLNELGYTATHETTLADLASQTQMRTPTQI